MSLAVSTIEQRNKLRQYAHLPIKKYLRIVMRFAIRDKEVRALWAVSARINKSGLYLNKGR
jgi:hypothetical protein